MENTDDHIIKLLKSGKEESIEILFSMHYNYLCKCVYKLIQDASTCEDIVQEVFSDIWRKRDKLNINASVKGYLRKAAINRTLNYIRSKKYTYDEADDHIHIESKAHSKQLEMEGDEMKMRLHRAIDGLPEKCRIVFSMSRFEELSYKEIAAKLGISVKTVENQISKALKVLKAELMPYRDG